jgi:hypothetical protein
LGPLVQQLDPGPSCEVLERIDRIIDSEIDAAKSKRDYEKISAITHLANSLEPHRRLCRVPRAEEEALRIWSSLIAE